MFQRAISGKGNLDILINILIGLAIFVGFWLIVAFIADRILRRIIGGAVKVGIQTLDKHFLGTQVTFDSVQVDLFKGIIQIKNMCVHNPEATPPYTSEHLLSADLVLIDLNMWTLLKSFLYTVEIEVLEFKGVEVIYDRPGVFDSKSNVSDVLDFMNGAHTKAKASKTEAAKVDDTKEKKIADEGTPMSFIVRKLDIQDVAAKAQVRGIAASLTIPPLQSDNLSKECDGTDIEDIVQALVNKLADSILHNALHL
jgi:hypothetical protein